MALGSHIKMYYQEGKEAYHGGVSSPVFNPYPDNSSAAANWEAGWTDAWYTETVKDK